ncbi:MAG: GNAT family N-acetyltransferase [Pyrinomonadaceae bacterium]|nr:GNAT family N-acetyltransferase [Pyrinomonadaceae bacterium]
MEIEMKCGNCELIEICAEIEADFRELADEGIAANETPYINWDGDFDDYLRRMQILAKGVNLPADEVPRNTYFLFCEGKIIGRSEIRRELNDEHRKLGGHIGGDIRRSERKKGYGTILLNLTLEKARELGLKRVLLTCDKTNAASARTIEGSGGIFTEEIFDEKANVFVKHYWMDL